MTFCDDQDHCLTAQELRAEIERLTERGMEAEAWCEQLRAEVERLRADNAHWQAIASQGISDEHAVRSENVRLRAALFSCPCPGGGWNGMPKGLEATVAACVEHKVCGCEFGRALEGKG